jgi:SAM-dependent methyltransferase
MGRQSVEELSQRYSKEAIAYRDLWAPVILPPAVRLLKEIEPAKFVLEIGAGTGSLLPALRLSCPDALILGVDRSQGMLRLASGNVALMDAMQLALASERFDLALMNFVLFHLSDPLAGLKEAHRVLKSGGQVGTVTWGSDLVSAATTIWDEELELHGAPPPPDPSQTQTRHDWVDTPDKMNALLTSAGFHPVRAWQEQYEHMIDADHLIRLRTSLGRHRARFDALTALERESCVNRARERMSLLRADEFLVKGWIVYALGRRQCPGRFGLIAPGDPAISGP